MLVHEFFKLSLWGFNTIGKTLALYLEVKYKQTEQYNCKSNTQERRTKAPAKWDSNFKQYLFHVYFSIQEQMGRSGKDGD